MVPRLDFCWVAQLGVPSWARLSIGDSVPLHWSFGPLRGPELCGTAVVRGSVIGMKRSTIEGRFATEEEARAFARLLTEKP